MGTPNPSARGDAGFGTRIGRLEDNVEQLRRLITRRPKIPAPVVAAPVATGGGVVGMAELVASSGSVAWNAGRSTFSYDGVTYSTVRDPNAGSGGGETKAPLSSWLTVNGFEITLAPGWYIPVLNMRILWSGEGSPASFTGPYMQGGWDIAHNDTPIHPKTPLESGSGLWQIANYGPTYMGAGTTLYAQSWAIGGPPTADNDAAGSAITWNITKLG